MYGCVRAAVNGSRFGGDKQFAAVWGKAVTIERLEGALACGGGVEQHFDGLARFERIFDDLCPFGIHLRIVFAVARNGDNAVNVFGPEGSRYHVF